MTTLGKMILWALLAYWIAGATGMHFLLAAVAVFVVYQFGPSLVRGAMTPHGTTTHATHAHGGRNWSILVAFVVATGVMVMFTWFVGISNNYGFHELIKYGWRPWLWPGAEGMTVDFRVWVAFGFLALGIGITTARGNYKVALYIFVFVALLGYGMKWAPTTTANIVPIGPTALAEADVKMAEEGVPLRVAKAVGQLTLGTKGTKVVGDALSGAKDYYFSPEASTSAGGNAAVQSPVVVQTVTIKETVRVGKVSRDYFFHPQTGCVSVVIERTPEYVILIDPQMPGRSLVDVIPPVGGGDDVTIELGVIKEWDGVFSKEPYNFCRPPGSNAIGIRIAQ